MNANKFWMKLSMAGTLLALIFTTACGMNAPKSPAEAALAQQGNAIMTVLQSRDLDSIRTVLTTESQKILDKGTNLAIGVVNVHKLVEQSPKFVNWDFTKARIFTRGGVIKGTLNGKVIYADGKSGKIKMNLEQQDGTWKLSGWTFDQ